MIFSVTLFCNSFRLKDSMSGFAGLVGGLAGQLGDPSLPTVNTNNSIECPNGPSDGISALVYCWGVIKFGKPL